MSKKALHGTKIFVRRLLKQDINIIIDYYKVFDKLFYNPVSPVFVNEVLVYGEIWGAFVGEKIIGCCYYFNANSDFFKGYNTYTLLKDFIENMKDYYYIGYCHILDEFIDSGLYAVMLNIGEKLAYRHNKNKLLYTLPLNMSEALTKVFKNDFRLIQLRGLDNLVTHYIFEKAIPFKNNKYAITNDDVLVSINNSKILSKQLEHGYCGVTLFQNNGEMIIQLKKSSDLL